MRAPAYIWHVTLQTGHGRRCLRSEVADHIVDGLEPLLAQDGEAPMPRIPDRTLKVTRSGHMLLATIFGSARAPICTIAVAGRSRGAPRLWALLQEGGSHAADPPHAPWCAARIEPGLALYPQDVAWLGDFERYLAWTWIERYCQ